MRAPQSFIDDRTIQTYAALVCKAGHGSCWAMHEQRPFSAAPSDALAHVASPARRTVRRHWKRLSRQDAGLMALTSPHSGNARHISRLYRSRHYPPVVVSEGAWHSARGRTTSAIGKSRVAMRSSSGAFQMAVAYSGAEFPCRPKGQPAGDDCQQERQHVVGDLAPSVDLVEVNPVVEQCPGPGHSSKDRHTTHADDDCSERPRPLSLWPERSGESVLIVGQQALQLFGRHPSVCLRRWVGAVGRRKCLLGRREVPVLHVSRGGRVAPANERFGAGSKEEGETALNVVPRALHSTVYEFPVVSWQYDGDIYQG